MSNSEQLENFDGQNLNQRFAAVNERIRNYYIERESISMVSGDEYEKLREKSIGKIREILEDINSFSHIDESLEAVEQLSKDRLQLQTDLERWEKRGYDDDW